MTALQAVLLAPLAAYAVPGLAVAAWVFRLIAYDDQDIFGTWDWVPAAAGVALLAGAKWPWTLREALAIARRGAP